jgi:DNA-binding response OmpR family regulator
VSTRDGDARAPAHVLIVDDERANRTLLEIMLAPEGYVLSTATSGDEALAMIAREAPDLVLLDVMMPGINGYVVAAKIKEVVRTRPIHVLMLSSLDDRNSRTHGLGAGADGFLTKPVDRTELCEKVRTMLRAPTAAPGTSE